MIITRCPKETDREIPPKEYLGPHYKKWLEKHIFPQVRDPDHNQSVLILIIGKPGVGKTTLSFLSVKEYYQKKFRPETVIASDKESFGRIIEHIRKDKGHDAPAGAYIHDEANYSKYAQGAIYEKKTREYFSVQRERNYLFFFNSPKGAEFDKEFLDLFHYVIFVARKGFFYVIPIGRVLRWLKEGKRLNVDTMEREGIAYVALFASAWKRYEGSDWQAYLKLKHARMDAQSMEVEDYFIPKTKHTLASVAKSIGVRSRALKPYVAAALEAGILPETIKLPSGQYRFSEDEIGTFKAWYYTEGANVHKRIPTTGEG